MAASGYHGTISSPRRIAMEETLKTILFSGLIPILLSLLTAILYIRHVRAEFLKEMGSELHERRWEAYRRFMAWGMGPVGLGVPDISQYSWDRFQAESDALIADFVLVSSYEVGRALVEWDDCVREAKEDSSKLKDDKWRKRVIHKWFVLAGEMRRDLGYPSSGLEMPNLAHLLHR
jgi:hypothetical protein